MNPEPGTLNILVRWQSVTGQTYFLERASTITPQPAFSTIATNIPGKIPTTTYVDTTAIGGPFFYRVGVQP
jgi:hypothetical protein